MLPGSTHVASQSSDAEQLADSNSNPAREAVNASISSDSLLVQLAKSCDMSAGDAKEVAPEKGGGRLPQTLCCKSPTHGCSSRIAYCIGLGPNCSHPFEVGMAAFVGKTL